MSGNPMVSPAKWCHYVISSQKTSQETSKKARNVLLDM